MLRMFAVENQPPIRARRLPTRMLFHEITRHDEKLGMIVHEINKNPNVTAGWREQSGLADVAVVGLLVLRRLDLNRPRSLAGRVGDKQVGSLCLS